MSAADPLLDVFATEARASLAALEGDDEAAHAAAFEALAQAAALVDDATLIDEVARLRRGSAPDAARALRALVAGLSRGGDRPEPPAIAEPPAPRRRSTKFATSEHRTLLALFRDEAHEALDRITALLAAAPDAAALDELMRTTHGIKGAAGTVDLPVVADLTHRLESCFDRLRRGKLAWSSATQEALVDAADALRALIASAEDRAASDRLAGDLRRRLAPLEGGGGREDSRLIALEPGDSTPERRAGDRRRGEAPILRVDPARVDRLMDSVGELVFDRTRLERRVAELARITRDLSGARAELDGDRSADGSLAARLSAALEQLERTTRGLSDDARALRRTERALQDGLTGVRMQRSRALFQRLAPPLRTLARAAGREVRLAVSGGDTEFDKSVADQIADPLLQLLRNAVAHGIEPAEERARLGKPPQGTIAVSARHEGSEVVLEVGDDGAGIDAAALRRRFVDSGRWSESRARIAGDDEVLRALFESGVSSRDEADPLAGRGVGLGSVRETVTRLGGEVLLRSTPGEGTTFTLRLPLTTAVANALLFKLGGHVFAVPNVHVLATDPIGADGQVTVRGQPVPLLRLHDLLGLPSPEAGAPGAAVAIEYAGQRLALGCDRIVGPREIVLKSLGPLLSALPLYAGGTVSGSGKVQLILDPAALVRLAAGGGAPGPRAAAPPVARAGAPRARVLVVDDSRVIREAMVHLLDRAGYPAAAAVDGEDAWRALAGGGFDLLVTDLEMPRLGGFDLVERVRGTPELAALPVVVISSRVDGDSRERARALGVDRVLAKPVTGEQLVAALSRLVTPGADR